MIKKCLEKGASPAEEIETTYPRYEGGSYIETRSTPTEYVMKCRRMSTETKQQILSLLQSYLSPDPLIDIPF